MSLQAEFTKLMTKPAIAALSMAAVFAPLAANGNEQLVSTSAPKVEKAESEIIKIQFLDPDQIESQIGKEFKLSRAESFVRDRSQTTPVILISAGGKKEYRHAAHYAEKIHQSLKAFGYDIEVWAMKSDRPNVSSMTCFYKDTTFEGTDDLGHKTPEGAYEKRMAFASFCEHIDKNAKTVNIKVASSPVATASFSP